MRSHARQTSSTCGAPDSDIDLLVVFDHIDIRHHDLALVQHSLDDLGAPVDVLVTDTADLAARRREPGVLRVALREGRIVYQRVA